MAAPLLLLLMPWTAAASGCCCRGFCFSRLLLLRSERACSENLQLLQRAIPGAVQFRRQLRQPRSGRVIHSSSRLHICAWRAAGHVTGCACRQPGARAAVIPSTRTRACSLAGAIKAPQRLKAPALLAEPARAPLHLHGHRYAVRLRVQPCVSSAPSCTAGKPNQAVRMFAMVVLLTVHARNRHEYLVSWARSTGQPSTCAARRR